MRQSSSRATSTMTHDLLPGDSAGFPTGRGILDATRGCWVMLRFWTNRFLDTSSFLSFSLLIHFGSSIKIWIASFAFCRTLATLVLISSRTNENSLPTWVVRCCTVLFVWDIHSVFYFLHVIHWLCFQEKILYHCVCGCIVAGVDFLTTSTKVLVFSKVGMDLSWYCHHRHNFEGWNIHTFFVMLCSLIWILWRIFPATLSMQALISSWPERVFHECL